MEVPVQQKMSPVDFADGNIGKNLVLGQICIIRLSDSTKGIGARVL